MVNDLEKVQEVLIAYRRLRSPYKVARALGYATRDVWEIIEANEHRLSAPPERHGGEGPENVRKWLIARTKPSDGWKNDDPDVALARQRFCDGTHTMVTGRDGGWLLLYSIPLKTPVAPRPDYFKPRSF